MQSIGGLRSDSKVTIQEEGHYTKKVHCKAPSEHNPDNQPLVFAPEIELMFLPNFDPKKRGVTFRIRDLSVSRKFTGISKS